MPMNTDLLLQVTLTENCQYELGEDDDAPTAVLETVDRAEWPDGKVTFDLLWSDLSSQRITVESRDPPEGA